MIRMSYYYIGKYYAVYTASTGAQRTKVSSLGVSVKKGFSVSEVSPLFHDFPSSNSDKDLTCITVPLHTLLIVHSDTRRRAKPTKRLVSTTLLSLKLRRLFPISSNYTTR